MPLDPIVSLAVALAESPGSIALFLGSGVSFDAGVPTGRQIYLDTLGRLHRLVHEDANTPDDDELEAWIASSDHAGADYSSLLDLVTPDAAVRREYLASFFRDKQPGETHKRVADLVVRGLVKVVVTTNFDRLLEHALAARGIDPVVVSDDATLQAAPRREHTGCFVLKAHGDYLQETIRNTPRELAELEPAITAEIRAIFDRYGLVFIGYGRHDAAITQALRARESRYGVWWLTRAAPPHPPADALVEACGGRPILRPSASEFLRDLDGRLSVYEAHPSGHTPADVHDEILTLLRRHDHVGLDEAIRREQHEYDQALRAWSAEHAQDGPSVAAFETALPGLIAIIERQLAMLLPLALHDSERFVASVDELGFAVERRETPSSHWDDNAHSAGWFIGYVLGALLVRLGRWRQAAAVAVVRFDRGRRPSPDLLLRLPGRTAEVMGMVHQTHSEHEYYSATWEALVTRVATFDWLAHRYAELYQPDGALRENLKAFDLVAHLVFVAQDKPARSSWTIDTYDPLPVARRIRNDPDGLPALAAAAGLDVDAFTKRVPGTIEGSSVFLGSRDVEWESTIHDLFGTEETA